MLLPECSDASAWGLCKLPAGHASSQSVVEDRPNNNKMVVIFISADSPGNVFHQIHLSAELFSVGRHLLNFKVSYYRNSTLVNCFNSVFRAG